MANTIKTAAAVIGATATTIYTVPATTSAVVHAAWFANVHASNQQTITVTWTDSSAATTYTLLNNVPVPVNDTLIFDKPINLETGDTIQATCGTASQIEATVALMEIT